MRMLPLGSEAYSTSVEVEGLPLLIAVQHLLHVAVSEEDASPQPVMRLVACQFLHPAQHNKSDMSIAGALS